MVKTVLYEGPDISKHNGNVNIKAVRDAGYKRIGIRAGYGKNNIDEQFVKNATACVNLSTPVVIYWFSYAYTVEMANKEAEYCLNQVKKYWDKCPVAYDFEYDSVNYARQKGVAISKSLATNMAIEFLLKVKNAGYIPVIYSNKDYSKNYFDIDRIKNVVGDVYVWYAKYSTSLTDTEYNLADFWQYTSKGKIDGIAGNVDINRFYTDFDADKVVVKTEVVKNINISNFQAAANADGYRDIAGNKLVVDGVDGNHTQYVRKKINLKAKKTLVGYSVGSTGSVVKWWQRRLNEILGTSIPEDGKFGKTTRDLTITLQKKFNLTADGVAGYNTIQVAFYN